MALLTAFYLLLLSALVEAQWTQQTRLVNPQGGTNKYNFGASMSMSQDGQALVVGALAQEVSFNFVGAAYAYRRTGNGQSWIGPAAVTNPSSTTRTFGRSVVLLSNGTVAFISAGSTGTGSFRGAVSLQYRSSILASFSTGPVFSASDTVNFDEFGNSLACSADELVCVASSNRGLYVLTPPRSQSSWDASSPPEQPEVSSRMDVGTTISQSVAAISGDGNTVAIGSNSDANRVWVWSRSSRQGAWQAGSSISSSDPCVEPRTPTSFGFGVALGLDFTGQTLLVGAPSGGSGTGQVLAFTRPDGASTTWTCTQSLKPAASVQGDRFGRAITMDSKGNWAAIGAPASTGAQSVHVFGRPAVGLPYTFQDRVQQSQTSMVYGWSIAWSPYTTSGARPILLVAAPGLPDNGGQNVPSVYTYTRGSDVTPLPVPSTVPPSPTATGTASASATATSTASATASSSASATATASATSSSTSTATASFQPGVSASSTSTSTSTATAQVSGESPPASPSASVSTNSSEAGSPDAAPQRGASTPPDVAAVSAGVGSAVFLCLLGVALTVHTARTNIPLRTAVLRTLRGGRESEAWGRRPPVVVTSRSRVHHVAVPTGGGGPGRTGGRTVPFSTSASAAAPRAGPAAAGQLVVRQSMDTNLLCARAGSVLQASQADAALQGDVSGPRSPRSLFRHHEQAFLWSVPMWIAPLCDVSQHG